MTVNKDKIEGVEAVNAVEATLVTLADDPLLATDQENLVAVVGPGQVKDALVSSVRAAVSSASKRATSRGIVRITVEGVEVEEAALLWTVKDEITTAETVKTATVEKVETATVEMAVTDTAGMVVTATTTGATAHTLAAALPVKTIAEKKMETEAVMEIEVVMKWVGAWVRHLEGTTHDRHPASRMIVTVT